MLVIGIEGTAERIARACPSLSSRAVRTLRADAEEADAPDAWEAIATGDRPRGRRHEPNHQGRVHRATLWHVRAALGGRVGVINWPGSHARRERYGDAMVTDLYCRSGGNRPEAWLMPDSAVHPGAIASDLEALRVHVSEVEEPQVAAVLGRRDLRRLGPDAGLVIREVRRTLAAAATTQAAATWLAERQDFDLLVVRFALPGGMGHGGGHDGMAGDPLEPARGGLERVAAAMIERLVSLTAPSRVALAGVTCGPCGGAASSLSLAGEDTARGETLERMTAADLGATLGTFMRLPSPGDRAGRRALQYETGAKRIPSFDDHFGGTAQSGYDPAQFAADAQVIDRVTWRVRGVQADANAG